MGYQTNASGTGSTSVGYGCIASGDYSVALGGDNNVLSKVVAGGNSSVAMGQGTYAIGNNSTSMGFESTARGDLSTAMGHKTVAKSYLETVLGRYNDTTRARRQLNL